MEGGRGGGEGGRGGRAGAVCQWTCGVLRRAGGRGRLGGCARMRRNEAGVGAVSGPHLDVRPHLGAGLGLGQLRHRGVDRLHAGVQRVQQVGAGQRVLLERRVAQACSRVFRVSKGHVYMRLRTGIRVCADAREGTCAQLVEAQSWSQPCASQRRDPPTRPPTRPPARPRTRAGEGQRVRAHAPQPVVCDGVCAWVVAQVRRQHAAQVHQSGGQRLLERADGTSHQVAAAHHARGVLVPAGPHS